MPSKWDETSAKLAEVAECKDKIRRIAKWIAPNAANRKDQYRELQKFTGLPTRRLKDFWHGYLNMIPSHQMQRIRAAHVEASQLRRERALRELELAEKEHAEFTRDVADYCAEGFRRNIAARPLGRRLGAEETSTADP